MPIDRPLIEYRSSANAKSQYFELDTEKVYGYVYADTCRVQIVGAGGKLMYFRVPVSQVYSKGFNLKAYGN